MPTRNELEQVISFGYLEKDFDITGFKVKMRTLTGDELKKIAEELSGLDDIATFRGLQIKILSRSLIAINGKPIQYIPENEQDPITDMKRVRQNEETIGQWQNIIINVFYEKYKELEVEQTDFLSQFSKQSKKTGQEKSGGWQKPQE